MGMLRSADVEAVLTPEDIEGYPVPGDVIIYTVNITNNGTFSLYNISLATPQVCKVATHQCHAPFADIPVFKARQWPNMSSFDISAVFLGDINEHYID